MECRREGQNWQNWKNCDELASKWKYHEVSALVKFEQSILFWTEQAFLAGASLVGTGASCSWRDQSTTGSPTEHLNVSQHLTRTTMIYIYIYIYIIYSWACEHFGVLCMAFEESWLLKVITLTFQGTGARVARGFSRKTLMCRSCACFLSVYSLRLIGFGRLLQKGMRRKSKRMGYVWICNVLFSLKIVFVSVALSLSVAS